MCALKMMTRMARVNEISVSSVDFVNIPFVLCSGNVGKIGKMYALKLRSTWYKSSSKGQKKFVVQFKRTSLDDDKYARMLDVTNSASILTALIFVLLDNQSTMTLRRYTKDVLSLSIVITTNGASSNTTSPG